MNQKPRRLLILVWLRVWYTLTLVDPRCFVAETKWLMFIRLLTVAVALLVLMGCSRAAMDRARRFFFEVPQASSSPASAADPEAGEEEPPELALPGPQYASVHPPVLERKCLKCHDAGGRMQVRDDLLDSCRGCHGRFFSEEVGHPPVADGECLACHTPHRSEHPTLLIMPAGEVCLECHDEPDELSEAAHGGEGAEHCIGCHDPHFGGKNLLKPTRGTGPEDTL